MITSFTINKPHFKISCDQSKGDWHWESILSQRWESFILVFVILWTQVCQWRLKSEAGGGGEATLKKSENLFFTGLCVGSGQVSLSHVIITPVSFLALI